VRPVHADCDRAREWASADLDGELSTFERALLEGHLAGCPSCSEFHMAIGNLTGALRAASRESFEVGVSRRTRRRVSLRLAPAVAAMAVAAVGLGSFLASSAVQPGSINRVPTQPVRVIGANNPDTMNLAAQRRERLPSAKPVGVSSTSSRMLRGGPVAR